MNNRTAAEWLASPQVTEHLKRVHAIDAYAHWVIERPNGSIVGSMGNLDKYGPWQFDSMASAEAIARTLDADYDMPEGSHKVVQS